MNLCLNKDSLRSWFLVVTGLLVLTVLLFSRPTCPLAIAGNSDRPAQWAIPMNMAGVANLHKINDGLYRSAQPTKEGMMNLERMGIKTVINLRSFHSDSDELKGTALLNDELSVKTWHIEDEDVIRVLRILRKTENGPFLIHCQHGADRTGVMSALYRIVVQGWSRDEAIKEMVDGGYRFHSIWSNIVQYVNKVDVDMIKREVAK
jgi:protein tyrosine/serine phosphatase